MAEKTTNTQHKGESLSLSLPLSIYILVSIDVQTPALADKGNK